MKQIPQLFFTFLLAFFFTQLGFSQSETSKKDQRYIFFLHNAFVEENPLNVAHPEYGRAEYNEILDSYRKDNFIVFSEIRSKNTNAAKYAKKIEKQIKTLFKKDRKTDKNAI